MSGVQTVGMIAGSGSTRQTAPGQLTDQITGAAYGHRIGLIGDIYLPIQRAQQVVTMVSSIAAAKGRKEKLGGLKTRPTRIAVLGSRTVSQPIGRP